MERIDDACDKDDDFGFDVEAHKTAYNDVFGETAETSSTAPHIPVGGAGLSSKDTGPPEGYMYEI